MHTLKYRHSPGLCTGSNTWIPGKVQQKHLLSHPAPLVEAGLYGVTRWVLVDTQFDGCILPLCQVLNANVNETHKQCRDEPYHKGHHPSCEGNGPEVLQEGRGREGDGEWVEGEEGENWDGWEWSEGDGERKEGVGGSGRGEEREWQRGGEGVAEGRRGSAGGSVNRSGAREGVRVGVGGLECAAMGHTDSQNAGLTLVHLPVFSFSFDRTSLSGFS